MSGDHHTHADRDLRLENFAAELTSAVYPLVLGREPKESWLNVELRLWRALRETVTKWARRKPSPASSDEFGVWREGLLIALTESAISIALTSGIKGPPARSGVGPGPGSPSGDGAAHPGEVLRVRYS
jgi:hypothetical protein